MSESGVSFEPREPLSVSGWLVNALRAQGVEYVFAVPGGPLLSLYEELANFPGVRLVLTRHEEAAAFMADGYAQASGRLAVVCATTGPGAMHTLTGVASATSDSMPLVVITAQTAASAFGRSGLQDSSGGNWSVDTVEMLRTATKLSTRLAHPGQLPWLFCHMMRTIWSGRPGAVHLSLSSDMMNSPVPDVSIPSPCHAASTVPDAAAVALLAQELRRSRRPVILAGQGAKLSGAAGSLQQLARTAGVPVATTLKGKGVFPEDHAWALGVFGLGGTPAAFDYLLSPEVDLLLIIGSGLGEAAANAFDSRLVTGRQVIQIDLDPLRLGAGCDLDLAIAGDADTVLRALLAELEDAPAAPCVPDAVLGAAQDQLLVRVPAAAIQKDHKVLSASAVVSRMSERLPEDTILYVDNGNCLSWVGQHYRSRPDGQIHFSFNVASMGYSTGAAIGGQLAHPGRTVVAVTGDAAFAMSGMELHTAAELGLPVIWVVLNNGGNAMVLNIQENIFGHGSRSMYDRPIDAAAIARGLGAQAQTAADLDSFSQALSEALEADGPFLIDVHVDPSEVPWALSTRVTSLRSAFTDRRAGRW
ncbi:thiamine pyrophosphate-binding protein [Streptomyces sp. YGL11-2]|uniref:thiamine pyrophosphate-binding protein n=1 Tax=Streptomyces sp. YGL11-2 TaxID=3414028 RepID=UPI003CFB22BE